MEQLKDLGNNMAPWIWNSIVIAASVILGLLLKEMLHRLFAWYTKRTDYYLFKSITKYLATPVGIFIPLLILNEAIELLRSFDYAVLERGVELALVAAFAFLLTGVVRVIEDQVYIKNDLKQADNLKARKIRTQIEFVARIAIVIITVVAVAAMLLSFESLRKIGTGLLAGVGIGSIIIGFAAQSSLSNLLAGFQIAFTQPIRIDDVVVLEGEWGRIEDITLTYVVVKIWDERRLVLPIRYFIEKPFQNWTRVSSDLIGSAFFYLDYTTPVEKLRQKFEEVVASSPLWDKRVKALQVTDTKERTMEVRAIMSARNSSDAFDLRCFIREKLIFWLQAEHPSALPTQRIVMSDDEKRDDKITSMKNPMA